MEYAIVFGLISLGYGAFAMSNAPKIAESNRDFIDSGRESYFEQRRAWKAYGTTPSTSPELVRRKGRREVIWGLILLFIAAPALYFLESVK